MNVLAAVIPGAPLLVPALAAGSAYADADLRRAVRDCEERLVAGGPEPPVVVVGTAPTTGLVEGTWDWAPFGLPAGGAATRGPPCGRALPTALAVGAWFLDEADPGRARTYLGVSEQESPAACAALGAALSSPTAPMPGGTCSALRLLVVADGSARRTEKAPGHLDPRAEPYDAALVHALRVGDPSALLGLDAEQGRALLAAGRAPLQVLAGAVRHAAPEAFAGAQVSHVDDPYGVLYVVARWWTGMRPAQMRAG